MGQREGAAGSRAAARGVEARTERVMLGNILDHAAAAALAESEEKAP